MSDNGRIRHAGSTMTIGLLRDLPDLHRGLCVGHPDPEIWFDPHREHRAKQICRTCPVRRPCLAYALDHEKYGVWGGTSEDDRTEIRNAEVAS